MADYKVTDTELTSIANAIRTKGGTSNQLVFPTGFVSAVQAIPTGGGGGSVSDVVNILNIGLSGFSLVPYYTSSTNPTGYVLSYSSQDAGAVPAWALFNTTIEPVTNGGIGYARWTASQARPQWVQIELPEAEKANAFYIATVVDGISFCKTYEIQASNDGTNFTTLYTETLENAAIGKYVVLPTETIPYKYYRIVVTDSYNATYSGLTSFFPMYINV